MKRTTFLVLMITVAFCARVAPADAELIGGVDFPGGAASFADAVIDFSPAINSGQPTAPYLNPAFTLGVPDYNSSNSCGETCTFTSLGDGGSITLQFQDNVLTGSGDSGLDLWVFEIGPDVEDTWVEISVDGLIWHPVGKVFGSTAGIDIDAYGFDASDRFSFIRLTDDGAEGGQTGDTVGADIDAVGAIASQPDCNILSVSPPFPWSVGDIITIQGAGFLDGSVPTLGGVEAAPFSRISSMEIQATVPSLIDGEYDLQVSMPGEIDCFYSTSVLESAAQSWGVLKAMYR